MEFVALYGIDGIGKTTACNYIYDYILRKCYVPANKLYRESEPTYGNLGSLARETINQRGDVVQSTLLLLADRIEHIRHLKMRGDCTVIMDRFMLCTVAYQGSFLGDNIDIVHKTHEYVLSLIGGKDHLHNILLDAEPIIAFNRMVSQRRKLDNIETSGEEFFNRVRETYVREMCNPMYNPGTIINSNQGLIAVKEQLETTIDKIYQKG